MRYVHNQSGAALIILLTIFILGSITFLLSQLNERAHYLLDDQEQTIRALTQAKESLLGFAATYAQNPDHEVKLQGYLPCPDKDGDGSAEPPCESAGQTVIGRFPWRTLGLPPLRDGSGECLWYAVSGNFKDNPKQVLTSDSNGLLVIKNAKDEITTGQTVPDQAIAVIFAPGRFTKNQNREVTGTFTECGSIIEGTLIEPINRVRNYLDKYNFDGVVVDNATANNAIFISDSGFFASSPLIPNATPVFINAPPVYETYLHPQDDTERLDRANPTFNDTLITIAPEDFKPVYRMMDYQVATQVRACLDRYAQKSLYHFMNSLQTDIGSTDGSFIFVKKFLEKTKLTETVEDILKIIKKNIANKNIPYPKYPWPSYVNPYDYSGDENNYFGRIPTQISVEPPDLLKTMNLIIDLFKADIMTANNLSVNEYENNFKPPLAEELRQAFKSYFKLFIQWPEEPLLSQWPVDPQTPFLILNLHDLEYETLKNDPQVSKEELITKVLDTFKDKDIEKEFFDFYQGNDPTTRIKNISTKVDLIEDLKTFSKRGSAWQKLQRYQCFFFDETNLTPSRSKWWWWQGWQDKVFFAIHPDYSLNNNFENSSLSFNTPAEKDNIIKAEMLVLVAGRPLTGQQRSQPEQQIKITNYLEGQNSDGDTHFVHAPVTSIFNDVVL
jgi:hypothetical protein